MSEEHVGVDAPAAPEEATGGFIFGAVVLMVLASVAAFIVGTAVGAVITGIIMFLGGGL